MRPRSVGAIGGLGGRGSIQKWQSKMECALVGLAQISWDGGNKRRATPASPLRVRVLWEVALALDMMPPTRLKPSLLLPSECSHG